MSKKVVTIGSAQATDARGIAEAVQLASHYESSLHILVRNMSANIKSIMGMMTLELAKGEEVTLVAEGSDEQEALDGLQHFFAGV
ncbi:MAG: HPr family phosphocarrier protein [Lachnospiraceae bacterium]|nr:HPr family phosphocarrier protein [Lachnospiraceae bacterium]